MSVREGGTKRIFSGHLSLDIYVLLLSSIMLYEDRSPFPTAWSREERWLRPMGIEPARLQVRANYSAIRFSVIDYSNEVETR